jgi:hypothetical protein
MQSFPHRGFDSDPGRDSTPDPVFPLRRQRSIARRVPRNWQASEGAYEEPVELDRRMPLARAWPFEQELDPAAYGYDDDPPYDDDDAYAHGVPQRGTRRGARILGFLALFVALLACGKVLTDPRAMHEALNWATLGHADQVLGVTQAGVSHDVDR